jgi:hypothetical protein
MVQAAKVIANILNIKSKFTLLDLDRDELPSNFDTICLFSVIHHTKNLKENCLKISESCQRILIECRLHEKGKKPIKNSAGKINWVDTSVWNYCDEDELFSGFSELFPDFKVVRNLGYVDKGRFLLELMKQ